MMLWKVLHSICNMQYALNMQYAGSRQVEKFLWDWLGGLSLLGLHGGAGGAGGGAHGIVDRSLESRSLAQIPVEFSVS